ncbi:MAG: VOC family protein [Pyrinomonadaceae bacterium]
MIPITRLNHAVLFVREFDNTVDFYQRAFGFEIISQMVGKAAFLRARGSLNHHDLGLFATPTRTRAPLGAPGLYHLAWEVPTIDDLAAARTTLSELGALVGESDHGATKSLYGRDPDGNEFEVMWLVPREKWGDHEHSAQTARLDLERELALYGHSQLLNNSHPNR